MLQRLKNYLFWAIDETRGKKSPEQTYDELSQNGKYDQAINYQIRVNNYKRALTQIDSPYTHVLDLACGTGALIDALNDNKVAVVGVDVSEGMLSVAKERFKKRKNIQFQKDNFMSIKFSPSSFELITIMNAIRFVPKGKEKEFAKLVSSWLTKNGTFMIVETVITLLFTEQFNSRFVKGSNMDMRNEKKLVNFMKPYFYLDKKTVNYRKGIFKTTAYYFKKNKSI